MNNLTPHFALEATIPIYYTKLKTNELKLSRKKYYKLIHDYPYNSCRESFGFRVEEHLASASKNTISSNNPYKLIPEPVTVCKGKTHVNKCSLIIKTRGVNMNSFFGSLSERRKYLEALDYIVGIIGTCLSHGIKERRRNKFYNGIKDSNSRMITHGAEKCAVFRYNTLSPFYITSPVLLSYISCLARNTLSAVYDGEIDKLFSKISYNKICRIIRDVNHNEALKVYNNIIVPFFTSRGINNSQGILLSYSSTRSPFETLLKNGFETAFTPSKTIIYWSRLGGGYGTVSFTNRPSCSYYKNL